MVTRRSGPDTACASELGSQRCQQLYDELKAVGLPAFDAEDDLLKTPASVFSKIQFGGLLGLAKIIAKASSNESNIVRVENIYQLLEQAVTRYESLSNIPYPELVDTMTAFKIKRKR
ncbi:MAG: hypothetical protein KJO81_05360, partial [Gammaproteobacteria bacterium]|nr:hypothetical protein [Gammaproteobacteria bacterium]